MSYALLNELLGILHNYEHRDIRKDSPYTKNLNHIQKIDVQKYQGSSMFSVHKFVFFSSSTPIDFNQPLPQTLEITTSVFEKPPYSAQNTEDLFDRDTKILLIEGKYFCPKKSYDALNLALTEFKETITSKKVNFTPKEIASYIVEHVGKFIKNSQNTLLAKSLATRLLSFDFSDALGNKNHDFVELLLREAERQIIEHPYGYPKTNPIDKTDINEILQVIQNYEEGLLDNKPFTFFMDNDLDEKTPAHLKCKNFPSTNEDLTLNSLVLLPACEKNVSNQNPSTNTAEGKTLIPLKHRCDFDDVNFFKRSLSLLLDYKDQDQATFGLFMVCENAIKSRIKNSLLSKLIAECLLPKVKKFVQEQDISQEEFRNPSFIKLLENQANLEIPEYSYHAMDKAHTHNLNSASSSAPGNTGSTTSTTTSTSTQSTAYTEATPNSSSYSGVFTVEKVIEGIVASKNQKELSSSETLNQLLLNQQKEAEELEKRYQQEREALRAKHQQQLLQTVQTLLDSQKATASNASVPTASNS